MRILRNKRKSGLILSALLLSSLIAACKRESVFDDHFDPRLLKDTPGSWLFQSPSEYDFNPAHIDVSGGRAKLRQIDQYHSDSDFLQGAHSGTTVSGGALVLDRTTGLDSSLSADWTPHFDRIVGYWKMDGSWTDSSSNGLHGTPSGSASFSTSKRVGSHAGSFGTNANDVVTIADHDSLDNGSQFSFSMWAKPSDCGSTNWGALFVKRAGFNVEHSYAAWIQSCNLHVDIDSANDRFFILGLFEDEEWIHIAIVFDGAKSPSERVSVYVNGEHNYTYGDASPVIPNYNSDLYIGQAPGAGLDPFKGSLDDFAIWNVALSPSEIRLIYDRQKQEYSGIYTSNVIDLGATGSWTGITAKSPLPFNKELPGSSGSENSSAYSSVSANLMNGLVAHWPFTDINANGTANEVKDFSGLGAHGASDSGAFTMSKAKFNYGLPENQRVRIPSAQAPTIDNDFSFQLWVKGPNRNPASSFPLLSKGDAADHLRFLQLQSRNSDKKLELLLDTNGTSPYTLATSSDVFDGDWHHVVYSSNGSTVSVYVDGQFEGSQSFTIAPGSGVDDPLADLLIGDVSSFNTMDEIAFWSRPLAPSEILQLYRRGANRIKYQVRSCVNSDCSGEEWRGPNGTDGPFYFSELQNYSSIDSSTGYGNGFVQTSSLDLTFADFPAAGRPVNNRYFQYRVLMESDDDNNLCGGVACVPELTSFGIKPMNRYYGGSPSISNKVGQPYSSIQSISLTNSGSCAPKYQLSNDGTNFHYWNGSAWTIGTNHVAHASSATDVIAQISDFNDSVGSGDFFFRAFLPSDTSQNCELDQIKIDYTP